MKRMVSFSQYEFLKREFNYLEETGHLQPHDCEKILELYQIQSFEYEKKEPIKLNFVQILLIIGAVLIGLGVLSFVASNWSGLSDFEKFGLLLTGLIASYVGAWFLELKAPKLSQALYYIGVFSFGAEVIYVGQLFHLGGNIGNAFLVWAIGVLPLAYYLKDRLLYVFGFGLLYLGIEARYMLTENPSYLLIVILLVLFGIGHFLFNRNNILFIANLVLLYQFIEMKFMFGPDEASYVMALIIPLLFAIRFFIFKENKLMLLANVVLLYQFVELKFVLNGVTGFEGGYPWLLMIIIPFLYAFGHKWMNKSVSMFVANFVLTLQWAVMTMSYLNIEVIAFYVLLIFVVGIVQSHIQLPAYKNVMKVIGFTMQFIAGLILSFSEVWRGLDASVPFWLIFGILYACYILYLVYNQQLMGVVIFSVLIVRFYVDISLQFMNKSIAFFIGGFLLIALGYWIEKTRRGERRKIEKS
jgi:uncharacterized membrane protein